MQNTSLHKAQAGIKIARRNINNHRYEDDTTLIAESEEELKSLLMKVKEDSEKFGLKLSIKKQRSWHPAYHFMANSWKLADFLFLGSKITADGDCSHEIKGCLLCGRKAMINLDSILKKQRYHFADKGLSSQSYGFSRSHVWM